MVSLIGTHNRTNGIKKLPCRTVLSLNGVGLGGDETHPDTVTIVRDTRAFPDGEAPPDWRTYDGSDWPAFGEYWYAIHDTYWQLNPADFYQLTNEQGGGEGADVVGNYEQLVKVERAIMQAANADGRKCCILNLAGGSPGDFELWKSICAPFIVEAWESGGNVYGRHAYADKFVNDGGSIVPGQPARVIAELEYLRSIGYGGGVVLTECGLFGGYGVADYDYFAQQMTRWEQALRPYADIFIGLCWWECGTSEFEADYTDHLKQLLPYIEAGDLPRWTPPIIEEPTMDCNPRVPYGRKYLVAPQDATLAEWIAICETAFPGRNSVTFSYDDAGHAPGVTSNTAVLHGIPLELQQLFIEWYAAHYPETVVEFADDTPPTPPPMPEITDIVNELPKHATLKYATRPPEAITTLTIHHTVSPPDRSIESIAAYHVDSNNWPGIGYHYVIKDDGRIYQTNYLTTKSYHAGSAAAPGDENYFSVGIALQGDFTNAPPPQAQLDAARALVAHLRGTLPTVTAVLGHRQMPGAATQCPGNTWAAWLPYVAGGEFSEPEPEPDPPPPPAKTYDLLTYMRGPDKIQYDTDAKSFTQTYQYRHEENSAWKLVKGGAGQYEALYADAKNIYRREDTSQGNDRFYVHYTNGIPGAPWVKRHMAVGETAVFNKDVIHYWNDCSIRIPKTAVSDSIRLNAVYDSYTFPGTGQTLANVVELEWLDGGEKYWFAAGFGLVGFTDGPITSEFMGGPLQGRADLPVNVPGCVDLSGRYYVP